MRYYLIILILYLPLFSVGQSLEEFQQIAFEQNTTLKGQYKKVEAALQRVDQQRAFQDPKLSFGYFIRPTETRVGPQRARISLSQMFPWFGTRAVMSEAAALQADAAYEEFLDLKNQIAFEVAKSYYALYEVDLLIKIDKEHLALLENLKSLVRQKYESSQSTMVDLLRLQMNVDDRKSELKLKKEEIKVYEIRLNRLLDRDPDKRVSVVDQPMVKIQNNLRVDTIWSEHPKVKQLEYQEKALAAAELGAKKSGMPQFGLGLDYVIVDKREDPAGLMSPPVRNGQDVIMPSFSISLPIFRKSYKAEIKEKQLMQEYYHFQQEDAIDKLNNSWTENHYQLEKQEEFITLYSNQLDKINRAISLSMTAYTNGELEATELFGLYQDRLIYERKRSKAFATFLTEKARYRYIVGGADPSVEN